MTLTECSAGASATTTEATTCNAGRQTSRNMAATAAEAVAATTRVNSSTRDACDCASITTTSASQQQCNPARQPLSRQFSERRMRTAGFDGSVATIGWTKTLALSALFLGLELVFAVPAAAAKKVTVDWTLESNLFNKGNGIRTKYVRMNDVLSIRCAPVISLKIYMVPKESALFCRAPAAKDEDSSGRRLRQTIGTCAPNSSSPTVKVRATALANSPVFQPRQSYFLITTSTGTSEGIENTEGGLCQTHAMRLRLVVVDETDPLPGDELTNFDEIFPNLRSPPSANNAVMNHRTVLSAEELAYDISRRRSSFSSPHQAQPPSSSDHDAASLADTSARYQQYGAAWQRHRLPLTDASHIPKVGSAAELGSSISSSRFPAILTLEENGRMKTITVYNSRQLQEEINYASERNNRIQHVRDFDNIRHLPEYSMTGHGKISALPISAGSRSRNLAAAKASHSDGDAGVWLRSAASRRKAGPRSQPDDVADDSTEVGVAQSSAYSSSLKATGAEERDRSVPASASSGHRPFTYVVGYNSADSAYTDDDVVLDTPASFAPSYKGCWLHPLASACASAFVMRAVSRVFLL